MSFTDDEKQALREGKADVVMLGGKPVVRYCAGAKGVRDGRLQMDRARSSQGGPGWVYLMRCKGTQRCKIGRSVDVEARLKRINEHGNSIPPYDIVLVCKRRVSNDKLIEDELHRRFATHRVRGEWFDLPEYIIDEIVAMSAHDMQAIIDAQDV